MRFLQMGGQIKTTTLLKTQIGDVIDDIEHTITFEIYFEELSLWDKVLLFFDKCLKRK